LEIGFRVGGWVWFLDFGFCLDLAKEREKLARLIFPLDRVYHLLYYESIPPMGG
jgi:hypothetical protein